jgi:hypothetical protein
LAGVRLKNKFIGAKIATRTRKGCSSTLADSLPFSSPGALNRGAPESQVSQQTPRWREMDSNLYGAFPVKWSFWFSPVLCSELESRSSSRRLRSGSRSARKGSRDRNGSKAWRLAA